MSAHDEDFDGGPQEDACGGLVRVFDARLETVPAWMGFGSEKEPYIAVVVTGDGNVAGFIEANDEEVVWLWAFAQAERADLPIVCGTPGLSPPIGTVDDSDIPEFNENPSGPKSIIVRALTRKKRGRGFRVMSDKKVTAATWPKAQAEAWKIARTIQPKKSKWWTFGKKSKMNTVYFMTYVPT